MATTQTSVGATSTLTKKIKVKVVMDKDGPCWNYAIEAGDHASDPYVKAGNKIDMGSGPGSGAEIEFRLQGKAGRQLDFKTTDPIWVASGNCPSSSSQVPNEIGVVGCTLNTLTINAFNRNAGDLSYRLNFVEGTNDVSWDPIIRNGGGGP